MTTSTFEAALARAKAKRDQTWVEVRFTLFGEEFSFDSKPTLPIEGIEIVGQFQKVAKGVQDGQADYVQLLELVKEFLKLVFSPESQERLQMLLDEEIIGLMDMVLIMQELAERVSGRPFTSSPSSPPGAPETGKPSMSGAPSAALTPPVSPSTAS